MANQNAAQKQKRQARAQHKVQRVKREAKREERKVKGQEHFTEPLTPKRAAHIAKADANLEYRPIEREIQSEMRGSRKREKEIPKAYNAVAASLGQTQQEGAAADAVSNAAITQQLANLGAQTAASAAPVVAQAAADPARASLANAVVLGNQSLGQQAISMNAPTIKNEAAFSKYIGGRRVSAKERGIEGKKSEFQRRQKMVADLLNAKKEKGASTVDKLMKLREGDRDYGIQNKAFGLNAQEAAEQAKHDAETAAASREGNRVSAANSKRTAASSAASTEASREGNQASARNATTAEKKAAREAKRERYEREHHTGNYAPAENKNGPTRSQKADQQREEQDAFHSAVAAYNAARGQGPVDWAKIEAYLGFDYGGTAVAKAVARIKAKVNGAGAPAPHNQTTVPGISNAF